MPYSRLLLKESPVLVSLVFVPQKEKQYTGKSVGFDGKIVTDGRVDRAGISIT